MLLGTLVRLRPVEEDDLSRLVSWRNKPSVWRWFFNKFPLSHAGQARWFEGLLRTDDKKLFAICTLEDDTAIGTIGLDRIDFANQSAELGNMLIGEEEFQGQGYAAEALQLLLSYSFFHLNMNRVYLYVFADNDRAVRLYERAGFQVEGRLRQAHYAQGIFNDVLLMALLRSEFSERRSGDVER